MGKLPAVTAITIAVLLVSLSSSGCTTGAPTINNCTPTPAIAEPTYRPNNASAGTLPASGHVYIDGKPVDGAAVVGTALDGSDSLVTFTDGIGAYTLNIRVDTVYNVTAYSQGLIHTITPVRLHDPTLDYGYYQKNDVADKFDITLSGQHNSTISGITRPGWILVSASPSGGGPVVSNASNYPGQYSINVEPGVTYRLSAKDYYGQMRFDVENIYYRNSGSNRFDERIEYVTVGQDETVLVDIVAYGMP